MHCRTVFIIFVICLLGITGSTSLRGQTVGDREAAVSDQKDVGSGQLASNEDQRVTQELDQLKQAVARLERKIDQLASRPSEFSHVEVQVVDQQGKPLKGFEVKLSALGDVQDAEASGVSDGNGIGLQRHLPYGRYRMTLSGHHWYARDLVTLEVGQSLELTVVAPTLDLKGELVLHASLEEDGLRHLPFGEWEIRGDSGWGTRIVPPPDEMSEDEEDWETFPSLDDGIEVVAVVAEIAIQRRTEQPDGSPLTWDWRRTSNDDQQPILKWLLRADGMIQPLLKVSEESSFVGSRADYFQALAPEESEGDGEPKSERWSHRERLGYHALTLGQTHAKQAAIELPAGEVELSFETIYGRPKQELVQVINGHTERRSDEIWLRGVVSSQSQDWLKRLLGQVESPSQDDLSQETEITPGEQTDLLVGVEK